MFVHQDQKVFIHIPKTGGSSIEYGLLKKASIKTNDTEIWRSLSNRTKELYLGGDYAKMKYAPHAKAYELKKLYPEVWEKYEWSTIVRNPYDRFCSMYFWYTKGKNAHPEKIHAELVSKGEMMVEPQYDYAYENDKLILDIVFQLEEIDKAFNYFNIKPEHSKNINRQKTESFYEDWPGMKAFVRDYYVKDFEAFGYDK